MNDQHTEQETRAAQYRTSEHAPQAPHVQRVVVVLEVYKQLWPLEVARGNPDIVPENQPEVRKSRRQNMRQKSNAKLLENEHPAGRAKKKIKRRFKAQVLWVLTPWPGGRTPPSPSRLAGAFSAHGQSSPEYQHMSGFPARLSKNIKEH